jgi:uncharacterized protein (DUF3084 family)
VREGRLAEHFGNYADYRGRAAAPVPSERRASSESKRQRIAEREQVRERARSVQRARKRLAALEEEIAGLEEDLEAIGLRLGEPEVYRDGGVVRALEAERAALRERVDECYREWERRVSELEAAEAVPDAVSPAPRPGR